MSKIAVVYKSLYGSSEKYAKWICEELNGDLFETDKVEINTLLDYDTIIVGGGIYASSITAIKNITKNYDKIKDKNIIVFSVGFASTDNEKFYQSVIDKNFTDEMKTNIKFFYFRGALNYSKMTFIHKSMMGMLKKFVAKKNVEDLTEDDKMLIDTFGKETDFTDKKSIEPLLKWVINS